MSLRAEIYVEAYIETVTLTEPSDLATDVSSAKSWARIDEDFDDSIVDMLIKDAQKAFRRYTRSVLYETTVNVRYSFDRSGDTEFRLPYGPVDSITHVQVDGTDIDYSNNGDWVLIEDHDEEDVDIEYVAKRYDPADEVDADIIVGIWKYIATNYDDRENTVIENVIREVPDGSKTKWAPYRRMQL